MHGYGVPHQLTDLGIDAVSVLETVDVDTVCRQPGVPAGLADAVFVINAEEPAARTPAGPMLGVAIEDVEGGVRVLDILPGSVAEATELAVGDVIRSAAGFPVQRTSDLIEIIRRQAPGTWLPLEIERDGGTINPVARFPSHFQKSE
jgi:S1-C subfamily serine protease